MMSANTKHLHWTQRVALVRHNLHAATRSGDFGFFKTLQAAGLMEGTNHFATLTDSLGEESDTLLQGLDNLNAGLGHIYQDAFKNVYDNVKVARRDEADDHLLADKSKLYVDVRMQKNMADLGIDRMTNSAITLIEAQPTNVQDAAANVWMTGVTLVADCMEVSLKQMEAMEHNMADWIRMEESWSMVKASVVGAVMGLKGVFSLMDPSSDTSSTSAHDEMPRSMSIASASSAVFRRLSNAFNATPTHSRHASTASVGSNHSGGWAHYGNNSNVTSAAAIAPYKTSGAPEVFFGTPVYRTPNHVRGSSSSGVPGKLPSRLSHLSGVTNLSPVLSTPHDEGMDPFDTGVEVPPMPEPPMLLRAAVM